MVVATVGVLVLAGVATVVTTANAQPEGIVPLDDARLAALTEASASCPAVTPARLAGQVMAATGFKGTPEGGIAGLSANEWEVWKPWQAARPDDESASVLALAHLTCDLIGNLRTSGVPGDVWRLAVGAFASSLQDVHQAAGVPARATTFVNEVETYASAYEQALRVGVMAEDTGTPEPTTSPTVTTTPTTAAPTRAASPTGSPTVSATAPEPQAPSFSVSFPDFSKTTNLRLNGSAKAVDGRVDLAEGLEQKGSLWATERVDTNRSFASWFKVAIKAHTDGLAFVIQAAGEDALGGTGGGIGYGGRPDVEPEWMIRPSVAVEIDTWANAGWDPEGQNPHIAVTTNGDITRHHISAPPGFSVTDNQPFYVWVHYSASAGTLTVRAGQSSEQPAAPLFTYSIDLRAQLGTDKAWIGFTGSTGRVAPAEGKESVLSWSAIQS
ncbi:L-type lectin-domain containing protein [Rhizomonospora bruguierae]|uniref:L-type lectin-domain containing protein n=1 Tax=Rhizomonospora bruguierae TaxID=1581705 RepID=UPI001BCD767D|nr:L-type lectin-domain containing protein [Micromonospora sp. NBRC 107566]